MRGRAPQRRFINEFRFAGREELRTLHAPHDAEARSSRLLRVVARRHLQRPAGGQLLVRIGDHKTPRIELRGGLAQIAVVARKCAVARDVHAEDVRARITIHHPVGEHQADRPALRKPGHAPAGGPVIAEPGHWADQRITVRREREGAVDPLADAGVLQTWKALEADVEFRADAVDVFGDQIHAIVPVGPFDLPVAWVALVDAKQHALALLLQIRESLEIRDAGHLVRTREEHRQVFGDQVMVLHRRQRQIEPDHPTDAPRPQASGIDDMFRAHTALLRVEAPLPAGKRRERRDAVTQDHFRSPLACREREGVRRAVRIYCSFVWIKEPAE